MGSRALAIMLEDPEILRTALNRLSDRISAEGDLDASAPAGLERAQSFEDCVWVLSSNVLNHGAARLMIDEAAHVFTVVRAREGTPRVVEIGRCRGGTTLLLAAAGGEVVSLDIDEQVREADESLMRVLSRIGLQENVALHIADSATFPVEAGSVDVLFVDGDHTYEGISRDVAHWLPALRDGGVVLFHDARQVEPRRAWNQPPDGETTGVVQLMEELRRRRDLEEMPAPGTLVQFRYSPVSGPGSHSG